MRCIRHLAYLLGGFTVFVIFVIFSTILYELQLGDWPMTNLPAETKIWLVGSNVGVKKVLADANLGKEVTVSLSDSM